MFLEKMLKHTVIVSLVLNSAGSLLQDTKNENISELTIGSSCSEERPCTIIPGGECNLNISECECSTQFPINLRTRCSQGLNLGDLCTFHEECSFKDSNSYCIQDRNEEGRCRCKDGFSGSQGSNRDTKSQRVLCIKNSLATINTDTVPAVTGLAIGLVILAFLLVFVAKLFSKARWRPSRGYGDASIPPTIVIDGKDLSENGECTVYKAGDPLSPDQLRKMSILSSVTLPLNKDINVRSVSPSNSQEHERLFGEDRSLYEQHITIISNRPSNRRESLADHAFPELHSKPKAKKKCLLILTRTRTDTLGRRHSVAVPLLPPPQGYDIEADFLTNNIQKSSVGRQNGRRNSSQASQMSQSPDKLQVPRRHSRPRRSSKQDFLHFLDLAVAN
ncbi:uncharacterized protein LOC111712578 isoform X2 [Eurytemora carolleeae]|uniref:uncharacterized protein LOC111712578 isoform X2 n=1 Tax=Eurytemora carolleeae TaxID=1294199 RepID=UPI000C7715A1|nr:uncharacterized protein LOC111712578 isoform X2 [Eurytemora carolleeae]|eukprot:XP_023343001.1 uncharacterized protein LOC111712578 isoform X2 [Eurytemora affinis]